ncbi:MAG: hypothetical protein LQ347_001136 [Umbilicaria vellea]|nr:MAG: hypothetical protein LQ347_001136 [Umbilicaria vellea]
MASSAPSSTAPSRTSTPNPTTASRFKSQAPTAEDLLQSQTVGLVHLSDFRKRRAEALEQKEREAQDRSFGRFTPASGSGAATPSHRASTPQPPKKKRKPAVKGKLSFGFDEENDGNADSPASTVDTPRSTTPDAQAFGKASPAPEDSDVMAKKRFGPNTNVSVAPKAMTKSALLREAQTREQLRKEFLILQEAVKGTEIVIPFVFYDGTNIPGGMCKVKKGDYIWVFLDRSRKVGAELGVGSAGEKANRREWARVGVDDLMLVRGEVIIPHHYEFYYFIVNKTLGSNNIPLFDYSALPTALSRSATASPSPVDLSTYDPLSRPSQSQAKKSNSGQATPFDSRLEGFPDDPNLTKVVDRRWYERNKHIFPASVWEEFDPTKDYSRGKRQDAEGNAFFFS